MKSLFQRFLHMACKTLLQCFQTFGAHFKPDVIAKLPALMQSCKTPQPTMYLTPHERSRFPFMILLMIALLQALDLVAQKAALDSFESVVTEHFENWDVDHDGKLTHPEIDRLIPLPGIPAQASAAIAALHMYLIKHPESALTFENLLHPPEGKNAPNFKKDFRAAKAHIAAVKRVLFAPGAPTLDAVHQGRDGDCFFLAPVGALLHRDPGFIRQKFVSHDDGSFDVKFPGDRTEHIPRITDVQIALTSGQGKEGLWLTALEIATARKLPNRLASEGKGNGIDSIDSVLAFGNTALAMAALTGHQCFRTEVRPHGSADAIRQKVHRALANQCIVSVAIGTFGEKPPPGLGLRHTYALLDYDRDKDAFLLWNPWGNTHRPKGPEGSANGYLVDHGRFFMPVADFVTYVKGMITIETNVPIQRKGSM